MAMPSVPSLWNPPDQLSLRVAIARCLVLLQREHGLSLPEIARIADCNPETIRIAYKRESTLGMEIFAALRFAFRASPHCFLPWSQLVDPETACETLPTLEERLDRIEQETAVIRRGLAESREAA